MAYSLVPLINGKSYEWADITINILGLPFTTVTKIKYEETRNMKNVKAAGDRVVSRIYGDYESTASISILMEDVENIQSVAPGGVIQAIPEFNITVTFIDPSLITRVHTIRNVRFMTNGRESERGGGEIEVEIPLIISHIEFV